MGIIEAFNTQVKRTPERAAIEDGERVLTYRELNEAAERIACSLQEQGVGENSLVGISMRRSWRMIAALLGILKAGGAYVPLDPAAPEHRRKYIATKAGVRLAVTEAGCAGGLESLVTADFDELHARQAGPSPAGLRAVREDALAYVLFTSGSTGVPKGVMVERRNVAALLQWAAGYFQAEELDRVLACSHICFDVSVFEIFTPLTCGGTLVLAENILTWAMSPRRPQVSLVSTVPSLLREIMPAAPDLLQGVKAVCLAGERLDCGLVEKLRAAAPAARIENLYGPTEATVYATAGPAEASKTKDPHIGRAIAGTHIRLLDEQGRATPSGCIGEICIAGAGVARGYIGDPELTQQQFVTDALGMRMYRTGDMGRWDERGNLEYLGRIDQQVKLRGFRIELAEIEAAAREHCCVRDAVAALDDDPEHPRLVCYVVASTPGGCCFDALRDLLAQRLPDYMVPAVFMELERLPLTASGKVDRRSLPKPAAAPAERRADYVEPESELERAIAAIWAEVLGRDRVGLHDHFFRSGGHSLAAMQVLTRLRARLGVDAPFEAVFRCQTVAETARLMERLEKSPSANAVELRHEPSAEGPLSLTQEGMWFFEQVFPGTTVYNMCHAVRLKGPVDRPLLVQSLEELWRRHPALRTAVSDDEELPVQRIVECPLPFEFVDGSGLEAKELAALERNLLAEESARRISLSTPPSRALLLQRSASEYLLVFTMHHAAADGWSAGILLRDLLACYQAAAEGRPLPPAPARHTYLDYARWLRARDESGAFEAGLAFWRRRLRDGIPTLKLPKPSASPAENKFAGDSVDVLLDASMTQKLHEACEREGVTLFMLLLTALKTALLPFAENEEVIVACPIANREHPDLEGLVGCLVNSVPVHTSFRGAANLKEAIARVRQAVLDAFEHRTLPSEVLIRQLRLERGLPEPQLSPVGFVLHNTELHPPSAPGLEIETFAPGPREHVFGLHLSVEPKADGLHVQLFATTEHCYARTHVASAFLAALSLCCEPEGPKEAALPLAVLPASRRKHSSVFACFQEVAARFPWRAALREGGRSLSYAELHHRACAIGRRLRPLAPQRVAIAVPEQIQSITGMFAALASEAAFVPVNAEYPDERLRRILSDSAPDVILTVPELQPRISALAGSLPRPTQVLDLEELSEASAPGTPLAEAAAADTIAYLLYTSGTTGAPKGVVQTHGNLLHHIETYSLSIGVTPHDRMALAVSPFCDAGLMDIFGALLNGATLVCLRSEPMDPGAAAQALREERISILHSTPSIFRTVADMIARPEDAAGVRCVVLGGEAAMLPDWELFTSKFPASTLLINGYGPTESTTAAQALLTHATVLDGPRLPIGQPVRDTEIAILPAPGAPDQTVGEIVLKSRHLAVGYWNDPGLSADRFAADGEGDGVRSYRTGDMGRWDERSVLDYLGRLDQQVKLRGYRIELGEIEAAARVHPGVRDAVAALDHSLLHPRLVCYVVPPEPGGCNFDALRDFLAQQLPDYMVPALFMELERLPLTSSGKVERRSLPKPSAAPTVHEAEYAEPENELERAIASIWADVLGRERVGRHDNFFRAGGHSLDAMRVMSRCRKQSLQATVRMLFENPTVRGFAEAISKAGQSAGEASKAPHA